MDDCKQINVPNMLHNTSAATTTAEKLLYDYAVEIVSNSYLKKIYLLYFIFKSTHNVYYYKQVFTKYTLN